MPVFFARSARLPAREVIDDDHIDRNMADVSSAAGRGLCGPRPRVPGGPVHILRHLAALARRPYARYNTEEKVFRLLLDVVAQRSHPARWASRAPARVSPVPDREARNFTPSTSLPDPRRARGGRDLRRGVELLEFTLVLLPLLGFTFLLVDLGWTIYRRATLQFAVREGCRYAVTNQTQPLTDANGQAYGVINSIKWVVQQKAIGFLGSKATDPGYSLIQVNYYDPNASLTTPLAIPTSCATNTGQPPNWGGNLVEVSVQNYQAAPLAPLLRSATPLNFTARSSDRLEANPMSGVPLVFDGTCN
jgi:hypothetical protein